MWSIFPAAAILLAQAQPDPAEKWCFERGQKGAQLCEGTEIANSREGVNMYFDQYDVLTTALAGKPGSAQEFPSLDAADKWAAQHDLAKLPHTVVKPPGAGRTFYLLQIGPAPYPTLQIACDYQQQCEIAGKPPR